MEFSIDNLLTKAYEYYYNYNNTNKKFITKHIDIKSILLNRIKMIFKGEEINAAFEDIFNSKLNFISQSFTTLLFNRVSEFNSLVTVSIYPKTDALQDVFSYENKDSLISYVLSDVITFRNSPHLIIPILNADFPLCTLIEFISKNFQDKLENVQALEDCQNKMACVTIRENFFDLCDLAEAVETNKIYEDPVKILALLFQVIHTLCMIREKYPFFNYNNMNINKMKCYRWDPNTDHILSQMSAQPYVWKNQQYFLPDIGICIKLHLFKDSNITDDEPNYDIKNFCKSLLNSTNKQKFHNKFILECINIMEPEQIMKNSVFTETFGKVFVDNHLAKTHAPVSNSGGSNTGEAFAQGIRYISLPNDNFFEKPSVLKDGGGQKKGTASTQVSPEHTASEHAPKSEESSEGLDKKKLCEDCKQVLTEKESKYPRCRYCYRVSKSLEAKKKMDGDTPKPSKPHQGIVFDPSFNVPTGPMSVGQKMSEFFGISRQPETVPQPLRQFYYQNTPSNYSYNMQPPSASYYQNMHPAQSYNMSTSLAPQQNPTPNQDFFF
ncbi:hypothetical protein nvc1_032 [Namao virus]|nr:hypothetical protein nvc1_032 [Namao virus]